MSEHTPGPWKIKKWTGKEATVIGSIPIEDGPAKGQFPLITLTAGNADAHLISAAPELLEAGDSMMLFHDSGGHEGNLEEALEALRTAIAKARGSS